MPPILWSPAGDATPGLRPGCTRTSPRNEGRTLDGRERDGHMFDHVDGRRAALVERKEFDTGAVPTVCGHLGAPRAATRRALRGSATSARPPGCVEVGEDASGPRSPQVGSKEAAGVIPARGCGCGADDHGDAIGGHPMADEQQRRRGNAATAESWTRASHVGETRRGGLGLSTGTKKKTSGGCAARASDGGFIAGERWTFGECGRPARGLAVGGASEPCQTQALCLDFTQTDRCRLFGVHGGESSSPGTGMDATSGAQHARPAMGRQPADAPWACPPLRWRPTGPRSR